MSEHANLPNLRPQKPSDALLANALDMKNITRPGILIAVLSITFASVAAPVNVETSAAGNMYISGGEVKVTTPVAGDLLAAGGRVSVEREVGVDAAIAGGSVNVRAPIRQDLRVAAGTANIDGDVGGELVAAGGKVRVADSSAIAGSAWLAGNDITLAGKVGDGAKITGNKIALSGEINGDTSLYGQDIKLLAGTRINGKLSYASPNPISQDPSAQVLGTVTRERMPEHWNRAHGGMRVLAWFHPVFVLSMIATGVLLYLLLPNAIQGIERAIKEYPLRSLLAGLALLFAVPPVAILFMITVIGIPVGLALFALYPVMLLLGYLAAAFFIGRRAADAMKQPQQLSLGRQALYLALALVILNLVVLIPFLGGMLVFALLVMGIGGWAVWLYTQYGARRTNDS
jgi:cytoskeletal protein CcmA (bactofilin family)